jgi:hypothetical protein
MNIFIKGKNYEEIKYFGDGANAQSFELKLMLSLIFPHQFDRKKIWKFFVWGVRNLSGISDNWGSFGGVYPGLPLGV